MCICVYVYVYVYVYVWDSDRISDRIEVHVNKGLIDP